MSHYFINDKSLKPDVKYIDYEFKGGRFSFVTDSGVFSKNQVDYATDILLNTIAQSAQPCENCTLLDMGCGYGCAGIVLAKTYSVRLTQCDVNPAAAELTRLNCKRNAVESVVIESDCFDNVTGKYDMIVINPPIHAGKSVTYKMYEKSPEYLNDGGRLCIVTLKKHGAESTFVKLNQVFGNCEILYKRKGFYVFECQK